MQYLNPIYIIPLLFWYKIQIQLKYVLFCKRNPTACIFFSRSGHTSHLSKESSILKLPNANDLENWLLINKDSNNNLRTILKNLVLSTYLHPYYTRWFNLGCLVEPLHKTKLYG